MAISEEEIKLILNTQDSKTRTHELATEVQQLNEYLRELAVRFNEGAIAQQTYQQNSEATNKELREKSMLLEDVARKADILSGTEGGGGMAGLSTNIFKAERAFTALATGTGLARAGPMLESVLVAVGGPAGLGMAIGALAFALEGVAPKLAKFFDLWDTEKLKAAADEMKKIEAGAAALLTPPRDEPGKAMAEALGKYEQRGQGIGGAVYEALNVRDRAVPTAEEKSAVQVYGMTAGPGRMAAVALGIAMSPEALQEQLTKRTREEASRLIDASARPGAAGKAARARLKKLRDASPNLFPNDFGDFLESVEETPGETAIAGEAIEEQDPDQQYMARHKEQLERGKQLNEQEAEARKRNDRITATYVEDAKVNEQEIHRANQEKEKAGRASAAATAKAARERAAAEKAAARAADPSNRLAMAHEAEVDAVTAEAVGQWNMAGRVDPSGRGIGADKLRAIISDAVNRLPDTGYDVAAAVSQAAFAGYQKSQADMARAMRRMQQGTESRLSP